MSKNKMIMLPREVVEQAQMWIPLLAEIAGLDPETTTAEFSEFADGRPASEFTIANVITALRAALEQPDPAPYLYYDPNNGDTWTQEAINDGCCLPDGLIALYTE